MRALHIAAAGGAAVFTALAISRFVGGMVGTLLLFAAVVFATLGAGAAIASGFEAWNEREHRPNGLSTKVRGALRLSEAAVSCTSCHRPMTRIGEYRVCASCDQIAVGR
jgi:amino acid transporter